jgi:tetratricopeptide (TPR) repeat protein
MASTDSTVEQQEAFQQALRNGHSLAWDRQWEKAVEAYQAALAVAPDDAAALTGLGMALLQLNHLPEALTTYQRLARLNPADIVVLEKVADLQEKLKQAHEAGKTYLLLAEAYMQQRKGQGEVAEAPAIEAWERSAQLAPDLLGPHQALAMTYERQGKTRQAIQEYLMTARLLSQRNETENAVAACQAALQLDPRDAEVLRALDLLRQGHALDHSELSTAGYQLPTGAAAQDNPALAVREKALSALAARAAQPGSGDEPSSLRGILTPGQSGASPSGAPARPSRGDVGALLTQGLNAQRAGDTDGAVKAYEQARAVGGPAAGGDAGFHFNLGLLYQEQLRFEEAVRELRRASEDPNYRLGSYYAMGECYRALGHIEEAVRHFIEALKIVDVSSASRDEAESVIDLYASLADTYTARGQRDQAIAFTNALVSFLSGAGWQTRAVQARQRLNAASAEAGMTVSLGEMLGLRTTGGRVLQAMADCRHAMEQGHILTAIEECYRAIELAPFYVPAHERLAELLATEERLEEAATKYGIIAQTYRERGDTTRAITACLEQLRLSPLALGTQETLIALLLQRGEMDRALEQTMALADAYYQLAQVDKAAEMYREGLKLASRTGNRQVAVQILHRLGDIDTQRLDWQTAAVVYKQVRRLAPDDERAIHALVELYLKLGQSQRALAELDMLLLMHKERGAAAEARGLLMDLANSYPEETGIRERLNAVSSRR